MYHGLGPALPHAYVHSPEVRHAAMTNFCKFYRIEEAAEEQIMATALGSSGWAFANVLDWSDVDLKVEDDDRQSRCVSIRTYEPNETETPDTIAFVDLEYAASCATRSAVRSSIS